MSLSLQNYFDDLLRQYEKSECFLVSDYATVDKDRRKGFAVSTRTSSAKSSATRTSPKSKNLSNRRSLLARSLSDRSSFGSSYSNSSSDFAPLSPRSARWSSARPTLERQKSDSALQVAVRILSPAKKTATRQDMGVIPPCIPKLDGMSSPPPPSSKRHIPALLLSSAEKATKVPLQQKRTSRRRRSLILEEDEEEENDITSSSSNLILKASTPDVPASPVDVKDSPDNNVSEFRISKLKKSDVFSSMKDDWSSPMSPRSARWSTTTGPPSPLLQC